VGKIGEHARSIRAEIYVILDPNAAPLRTIDARFNGDDRIGREFRGSSTCQPRSLVHFEADAMAERMPEIAAEAGGRYIIACNGIGIGTDHSRMYSPGRTLVRNADYVVHRAHVVTRMTDDDRSRDVGAITAVLGAKVEQKKIVALDDTSTCASMWQRRSRTRGDYGLERMRLAALIAQCLLENPGNLQLRDSC
jgi:hypothetical protein